MKSPPEISSRCVLLFVKVIRGDGRGKNVRYTPLVNKTIVLGTINRRSDMAGKKKLEGDISVFIDEKLNDVFGQYTSLGVSIGLKFPGNVEDFEKEIDRFTKRADDKVKQIMNGIATASGNPAPWK